MKIKIVEKEGENRKTGVKGKKELKRGEGAKIVEKIKRKGMKKE